MEKADADGILAALKEGLDNIGVKEADMLAKCFACNFDGAASVNQGSKHRVIVKLETMFNHVLVSVWYISHKLELAILDVIKNIDFEALVEEVSQDIFRFYHYSSRWRREVNEIEKALDEDDVHGVYFAAPKGIRWLAYRRKAYKAIAKHCEKVILHYEDIVSANRIGKGDEANKCKLWLKKDEAIQIC